MRAAAVYREVRRIHEHEQPVDAVLAPLWDSEGAVCLLDGRFPTLVSCMTSLRTLTEIDPTLDRYPDIAEQLSLEREALVRSRYLHGLTEAVLGKTIDDYDLHPDETAVVGRGLRDRRASAPQEAHNGRQAHVLFVGRMERRKGIDVLLGAARELAGDATCPIVFTLAGPASDPTIGRIVEEAAGQSGQLRASVHIAGAVSDRTLERLFRECDIVCAPSRYESHGVVLIEAMMFGKPIVTCDAGGIKEVVEPGHNALVVAPDDATALAASLKRLTLDADLRARLGAAARETYERRFEIGIVAQQTETVLERMIAANRGLAETSSDVQSGLERLLCDTFEITADRAPMIAGELLDPPASAWLAWADTRGHETSNEEAEELRATLAAQDETLTFLHERHATLCRIEQGGWWRLRRHLLPLLRSAGRLRSLRRA
jgi:hypothetical protein